MKFWICYLREKRAAVFLYLITAALFLSIGCLWHMENLGMLLYAALLTLSVWCITGVILGRKYVRRCGELERIMLQFEQSEELSLRGRSEERRVGKECRL